MLVSAPVFASISFTLLLLLAILSFPSRARRRANNSLRQQDVDRLVFAFHQYRLKNGAFPIPIVGTEFQLGSCQSGGKKNCPNAKDNCLDISALLSPYLESLPYDPLANPKATGYSAYVDAKRPDIVTVKSCLAENDFILSSR